jgi:hypothetical protein
MGLTHDHVFLWLKNVLRYGFSTNEEKLKILLTKCLITDQSFLKIWIRNIQIHQHKQTCKKKHNQFVDSNIQNHQWNV